MAMGDREGEGGGGGEGEGGGGGEGEKTVKVGQKISLKVNLKSFAPKASSRLPSHFVLHIRQYWKDYIHILTQ